MSSMQRNVTAATTGSFARMRFSEAAHTKNQPSWNAGWVRFSANAILHRS